MVGQAVLAVFDPAPAVLVLVQVDLVQVVAFELLLGLLLLLDVPAPAKLGRVPVVVFGLVFWLVHVPVAAVFDYLGVFDSCLGPLPHKPGNQALDSVFVRQLQLGLEQA